MALEWDPDKNAANTTLRGIDFECVSRLDWDTALTREDTRQNYGERRFVTIGLIDGVVHVVVHTQRGNKDRIISLRRANKRERKLYVEATDSKSGAD